MAEHSIYHGYQILNPRWTQCADELSFQNIQVYNVSAPWGSHGPSA